MGLFDKIKHNLTKHAEPHFTYSQYSNFWHEPDVLHETIMQYYRRDGRFKMAVDTKRDFSVGNGFYLTGDNGEGPNTTGAKILREIEDFCQAVNMDEVNSNIARDIWATGNCFLHLQEDIKKDTEWDEWSLRIVPVETIRHIEVGLDGKPTHYVQYLTSREAIEADKLSHFKMNRIGVSQFGEGMGQVAVRVGLGYSQINGKKLKRPSYFQIQEMITDISAKTHWAGAPRFAISAKGISEKVQDSLDRTIKALSPLQHFISSNEIKIDQMSLDTQGKQGDFIRHMENMMTIALQDPISKLWADQSFTYASSKEAINVLLPSIDMYQIQHSRFLEMKVFKRIIDAKFGEGEWEKHPVKINWGRETEPSVEDLKPLADIIAMVPGLAEVIDMRSLAEHIQSLGVDIKIKDQTETRLAHKLKQIKPPTPDDKMAEAMLKVADSLKKDEA